MKIRLWSQWFGVGVVLALSGIVLFGQTIFSPATEFTSVSIRTNGTNAAPSLRWTTDATGFYRIGLNSIGVAGALVPGAGTYDLGTLANPFRALYLSGTFSAQTVLLGNGNAGAPALAFTSQTSLGLYRVSAGIIGVTGNVQPSTDAAFSLGTSTNRLLGVSVSSNITAATETFGWNATAANNVMFRSAYADSAGANGAGMTSVRLGDNTGFGDMRLNRIAAGPDGQITFDDGNAASYWNFWSLPTSIPAMTHGLSAMQVTLGPTFSATMTRPVYTLYSEFSPNGSNNYTGDDVTPAYHGSYPTNSGNMVDLSGVVSDVEAGGNGNITNLFSFKGYCCSFDPASGTASTITRSGFLHLTQPFTSAVPPVTHAAIWIEDQTAGGTFVPSGNNYILKLDAQSSKTALMTAAGLTGLYGATPTSTAPLKVGGTIASTRVDDGNSGAADTLDLSTGNVRRSTLTGNVTYTLTNPADAATYQIEIFTGAGGFTAAWPASVKWPAGTAPTITITAGRVDLIELTYDSTSGDYFGRFWQNYTP